MTTEFQVVPDETLPLPGFTRQEMRAIAGEAALRMGWLLSNEAPDNFLVIISANTTSPKPCDLLLLFFDEEEEGIAIENELLGSPDVGEDLKALIRENIKSLKGMILEVREGLTADQLAGMVTAMEEIAEPAAMSDGKEVEGGTVKEPPFYTLLLPHKEHKATPVLLYINVLVFLLMVIDGTGIVEPQTLNLLEWGADFGPLTLTGEVWRTLTCNFVHIGIFHILMNMYALLFIGVLLEPLLGLRRMFSAYVLTGLCSAVCSLFWHSDQVSAGASGSIFGLYGVFLSLLLFRCVPVHERKALLTSILIFVGYNLLNGIKGGIDNAAHVGGLLSGLVLGVAYVRGLKRPAEPSGKYLSFAGEIGVLFIYIACFIGLAKNAPADYQDFRKEWKAGNIRSYLNGEGGEAVPDGQSGGMTITSPDQLPPYIALDEKDGWVDFDSEKGRLRLRYPSNWQTYETTSSDHPDIIFQRQWINASNYLVLTVSRFDTDEEYQYNKGLSLSIPRYADGTPSEDYKQGDVTVNGNGFVKTDNPQHFGSPTEVGYDMSQSVWHYFSEKDRMIYTFVMLINEDEAKKDLEAIMGSVEFTCPGKR